MKDYASLVAMIALICISIMPQTKGLKFLAPTEQQFKDWKLKYNKEYFSQEEHLLRFKIWESTYYHVHQHNFYHSIGQQTFKKQINKFADLSPQEFKELYLSSFSVVNQNKSKFVKQPVLTSNITVDWVASGSVTPVRNQGQCSGCWAFTATSTVESIYHIQSPQIHPLTQLSIQQLVDCAGDEGNMGCTGGFTDNAFKYLLNHKFQTASDYPFIGYAQPACYYNQTKGLVQVTNYTDVAKYDNQEMLEAVQQQTVSVMVDASVFQTYSSGIISEASCSKNLNHYVTIVGVNVSQDGKGYWKIQNSWGSSWGEDGYARLEYGGDTCGILEQGNYPILEEPIFEELQRQQIE